MELVEFIQIEPVGQCDRPRGVCPLHLRMQPAATGTPAFMHFNVFRELADRLAPQAELHFQGTADPLLHLHLFDMVRLAAGRGMRVSVHTDLTVLSEPRAEECANSGLHMIHVWMDGASDEAYEAVRGRPRFERVLRNLRRLMEARRKHGSAMQVQLMALATRANLHEIPALVQLAHDEGIGALAVRHLCHAACGPAGGGMQTLQHEEPRRIEQCFDAACALAALLGVALELPATRRRNHFGPMNGRRRCDQPWRGSFIGFDGQPVISCMGSMPDHGPRTQTAADGPAREATSRQEISCGD